jgi:hypothetical protein
MDEVCRKSLPWSWADCGCEGGLKLRLELEPQPMLQ